MFLEHISFVGKIRSKMREIGGLKIVVVWWKSSEHPNQFDEELPCHIFSPALKNF
jgi:hypothetical protein